MGPPKIPWTPKFWETNTGAVIFTFTEHISKLCPKKSQSAVSNSRLPNIQIHTVSSGVSLLKLYIVIKAVARSRTSIQIPAVVWTSQIYTVNFLIRKSSPSKSTSCANLEFMLSHCASTLNCASHCHQKCVTRHQKWCQNCANKIVRVPRLKPCTSSSAESRAPSFQT